MSWRTNNSHAVSQGACTATGCSSSDAKTTYSDGHAYCFSCNTYFPAEHRVMLQAPYETPRPKSDPYPTRLEVNIHNCGANYRWLKQYNLRDDEIEENYFFAPISDRHVFHCKDPETQEDFFEARTANPFHRPKSTQFGHKPTYFLGDDKSDTLVIVEDIVSAIKVGRHALVLPLFGSHLSPKQMATIGKMQGITNCILWLDCDKYQVGMQFAKHLGILKPSVAIQTLLDPKELDDDTILFTLENALDSLEDA